MWVQLSECVKLYLNAYRLHPEGASSRLQSAVLKVQPDSQCVACSYLTRDRERAAVAIKARLIPAAVRLLVLDGSHPDAVEQVEHAMAILQNLTGPADDVPVSGYGKCCCGCCCLRYCC